MAEFYTPPSTGRYSDDGAEDPGWGETFSAQFSYDNAMSAAPSGKPEPGFSPYKGGNLAGYEAFAEDFDWVQNPEQMKYQKGRIDKQLENQATVARSDRWSAKFAAGIADPMNLLLALTVPAAIGPNILRSVGKGVLLNSVAETPVEAMRRQANPVRSDLESVGMVGGAALFGGLISGAGSGISNLVVKREINAMSRASAEALVENAENIMIGPSSKWNVSNDIFDRLNIGGGSQRGINMTNMALSGKAARYIDADEARGAVESVLRGAGDDIIPPQSPVGVALRAARETDDFGDVVDMVVANMPERASAEDAMDGIRRFAAGEIDEKTKFILSRMAGSEDPLRPSMFIDVAEAGRRWGNGKLIRGGNQALADLGVSITNEKDAAEFLSLRLLALRAEGVSSAQAFSKAGGEMPEGLAAKLQSANELAAENYNLNRTDIGRAEPRIKDTTKAMGVLKKGLAGAADAIERTLVNTPFAKVHRMGTNFAKDIMDALIGDAATVTNATRAGRAPILSIATRKTLEHAKLQPFLLELNDLWMKSMGKDPSMVLGQNWTSVMDLRGRQRDFVIEATKVLMRGQGSKDPILMQASSVMDRYFKAEAKELKKLGLFRFQDRAAVEHRHGMIEFEYNKMLAKEEKAHADAGSKGKFKPSTDLRRMEKTYLNASDDLKEIIENGPISGSKENYMTRVYDTGMIRANREFFTDRVAAKLRSQGMSPPEADVTSKGIVSTILADRTQEIPTNVGLKALRERTVPLEDFELIDVTLPNGTKADFIATDGAMLMRRFAAKTGAYKAYAETFSKKTWLTPDENFAEGVQEAMNEMRRAGKTADEMATVRQSLEFERDSVLFRLPVDPTRWDNEAAQWIKGYTFSTSMALGGFSALPEYAMTILGAGFGNAFRVTGKLMNADLAATFGKAARRDADRAALMLEKVDGALTQRLMEDPEFMMDPSKSALFRDKSVDSFYSLTGQKTLVMNQRLVNSVFTVDASLRAIASKWGRGVDVPSLGKKNDEMFDDLLGSMGLSPSEQKLIAREIEKNFDTMFDKKANMFTANTDAWSADVAAMFNGSLKNRVDRMVFMANAPDQYKIMRGVVHVKDTPFNRKMVEGMFTPKRARDNLKDHGTYMTGEYGVKGQDDLFGALQSHAADITEELRRAKVNNPKATLSQADAKLLADFNEWKALKSQVAAKKHGDTLVIHSQMLSLPFLLMSWATAATKKITTSLLRNEFASPIAGGFSMFALAYTAEELKGTIRGMGGENATHSDKSWMDKSIYAMSRTGYTGVLLDYYQKAANVLEAGTGVQALPDALRFGDPLPLGAEIASAVGGVTVAKPVEAAHRAFTGKPGSALKSVTPLGQLPFWGNMVKAFGDLAKEGE